MTPLILALLLSQPVPQPVRGPNGPINLINGSVTQNGMTLTVTGGGGGSPGGVSGNLQINNGAGGFGAYPGGACTTPQLIQSLNASGAPTCYQLKLDDLANPAGDTLFTMANKHIGFNFTAPVAGTFDGAFELDATGGFSGDLFHVHQHIGNPPAGTDLIHVEFDDTDVTGIRITGPSSTAQAITATGKISTTGAVTVSGGTDVVPLSVNAVTGQTANLQNWQINGTDRATLSKDALLTLGGNGTAAGVFVASQFSPVMFTAQNRASGSTTSGSFVGLYQNTLGGGYVSQSGHRLGGVFMGGNSGDDANLRNTVGIFGFATENWVNLTGYGSALSFATTANGSTSRTEKMRVDHNGNVGIGYTSPSYPLDVNGTARATSFIGPLTGNADTATALAADPTACAGGSYVSDVAANGSLTCSVPPGTYTLPAASTTLGGVKMAAGCGAGNHVSSIGAGGELTCTADSGGGGAPTTAQYWVGAADATLSAEKDLSGFTGLVLNTAGTPSSKGTNTCTNQFPRSDNASGVWTCATIGSADLPAATTALGAVKMAASCAAGNHVASIGAGGELTCTADAGGGGGSPGGSTTQVQYNNAGAFAGAANVKIISDNLTLVGVATPATPAAGEMVMFGKARAGRIIPTTISPDGSQHTMQESLFSNHIQFMKPNTGTTVPIEFGNTWTGRASTGTLGTPAPATTNRYTKMRRMEYTTGAVAGQGYGIQGAQALNYLGNAAGEGGFFFFARFGFTTLNATGQRILIGLSTQNAALGATEPSTINNTVGICKDSTDAAASFCTRNGTTTTKNSSGTFTLAVNNIYDFTMSAAPNSTTVYYRLVNETSGTVIWDNLSTSTTTPAVNTLLYPWSWIGTSAASTQVMGINKVYVASDF